SALEARKGVPDHVYGITDESVLIDKPFWENLSIIVAGGTGEKSMIMPCWAAGRMVSQEIHLPVEMRMRMAEESRADKE
ncbi:MAG: hypothetical protein Q4F72_02075, partial [Desulfovibrionaceae bacterium]|nr:hypothetical protein [Desulfovibrionaceae bacterium]